MSLKSLFVRFTLIYLGLLIVIGIAFAAFGAKSSTSGNVGALIGAVMGVGMWFNSKNKRDFTPVEKRNAVLGMLTIDILMQTLVASALLFSVPGGIGSKPMLFGVLFVSLIHAPVIWFFTGWSGKQLAKDMARNEARRQQSLAKNGRSTG